jgi:hypothetical protein
MMVKRYLETRGRVHLVRANIVADIMRHFHARQHLGRAVVICDDPEAWLAAAQKQWLKLSRVMQRRRGAAADAVEILKYTYTITQMQQLRLTTESPAEQPQAEMHFVRAAELQLVPGDVLSVYLADAVADKALARLTPELPAASLVVDYYSQLEAGDYGLLPKLELERSVELHWQVVEGFLSKHGVKARLLVAAATRAEAMDDALDALLADDEFFLNDQAHPHESLTEAVMRHERAGRRRLARALAGAMRREPAGRALLAT